MIFLQCPKCKRREEIEKPTDIPSIVKTVEIICPDCDDGDFHTETWFDSFGKEVPPILVLIKGRNNVKS